MKPFLFLALCLVACAKHPPLTVSGSVPDVLVFDSGEVKTMPDPNEKILDLEPPNWTLYFEFDSSALREAYKAAALAEYLKKTGKGVFLSGYTSEEGSDEYNMALGSRRAEAVKEYLVASGVPGYQILCGSFGEEDPVTRDPEKFFLNRRVEVQIQGVR